ncbi:hypothetical protein GUJ93_ZPchr0010g10748 [Zizania palustris]|uniref:Uncharacterized protein n=1 Tax=Zizania palustris TaxID=103762 RepID=A0A8J6BJR0_ZIZPA|nr:hypothetical protein GUJ93_ZPchr0010g10748 [Zizania palustris]
MQPLRRFEVKVAAQTLVRAFDPPPDFLVLLPFSNLDLILDSFNISLIMVNPSPAAGFPALAVAVTCNNTDAELVVAHAGVALVDVD